jgi:hypothetical protein
MSHYIESMVSLLETISQCIMSETYRFVLTFKLNYYVFHVGFFVSLIWLILPLYGRQK